MIRTSGQTDILRPSRSVLILIALLTILAIIISILSLESGWFIIFQNFYYIPVILACAFYDKRGFLFSILLACFYLGLIESFSDNLIVIQGAIIRFFLFILVAGIITYIAIIRKRSEELQYLLQKNLETRIQDRTVELSDANKKMKMMNERLIIALEVGKAEIWELNLIDGEFQCREKWPEYLGNSPSDKSNTIKAMYSSIHPDDREIVWQNLLEYLERKTLIFQTRYRLQNKDGDHIWVLSRGKIVEWDEQGRPVRLVGTTIDITEQKNAEDGLNRANIYNRCLIETSLDPLVTIGPDGTITDVNAATEKITGWSRDYLIGTRFSNYFTDPEKADKGYELVFKTGCVHDYELGLVNRNGTVSSVLYNASVYRDDKGNVIGIFAAARDITEKKKAEDALRQANRKLTLLSGITRHDILNEVNILQLLLTMIKEKVDISSVVEKYSVMESSVNTIKFLIEFTRIYQILGFHEPQWHDISIILSKLPIPNQIQFQTDITNVEVYADNLFDRVFYNLLDNSLRHGQDIHHIYVTSEKTSDSYLLNWTDDGTGIPDQEKESIFERGYGKNTGLGLFFIREILSLTSITIKECGEEGHGAKFVISVPHHMYREKNPL